jgi:arylsulfatase A-like enzyme/Tfp pilus assembly protein PilF
MARGNGDTTRHDDKTQNTRRSSQGGQRASAWQASLGSPDGPRASAWQARRRFGFAALAAFALIVVAGAVWLFSGRGSSPLTSGACRGCNLLLVTIDTLRADRVGAFGGPAALTPNLDRLATEGLRLTRAYSSVPLTLPSHASILTATSPPIHGLRANGLFRLGPARPTLATILKSAGYRTAAFVGSFVLDARFGLNRGFDEYDDRYGEKHAGDPAEGAERRGEDVVKPALAWITSAGARGTQAPSTSAPSTSAPFFAWVHLYDPHEPYRAPQPYASQHEPYEAEIAYADAMVGQLLAGLPPGALDRTVIVIAADHGESLGEHGERTHGVFTYDVTMRIPWIIWTPKRVQASSDALVRLIDLAPTALDLVGVEGSPEFEGRSILPVLAGRAPETPAAYLEAMDANLTRNWAPLTGVVTRRYTLIELPIPELYDLAADPKETANLFARESERARALSALLRDMVAGFRTRATAAEKTTLNAEARQRLQALGYVTSSADPAGRTFTDADDPKRLIGAANDLQAALASFNAGSRDDAMSRVRAIARTHPGFATAYGILASMQRDSGDLRGAIATLEDVARRGIADQSVMVVLAGYLQEVGALDRSIVVLEAVLAAHPDYADAYNSLGVAYSRIGRHGDARAAFERVLQLDPTSATAYENLGVDDLGAGNLGAAAEDLGRALALDPRLARAHNALAAVYLRQRREADAIAEWRLALEIEPKLYDALYNLGTTLWDSGRRDDARPYLDRFVHEAPPQRYGADVARIRRMLAR